MAVVHSGMCVPMGVRLGRIDAGIVFVLLGLMQAPMAMKRHMPPAYRHANEKPAARQRRGSVGKPGARRG